MNVIKQTNESKARLRWWTIYSRIILFIGCLLLSPIGNAADVTVNVDRNQIALGETFNLSIMLQDNFNNSPDINFSPLANNFQILAQAQTSQLSIINGVARSLSKWVITLMPKNEGKLVIPSLTIGKLKTNPIVINVSKQLNSKPTGQSKLVFVNVQVSSKNPFLQSAILYTVKLYFSDAIKGFTNTYFEDPTAADANIKLTNYDNHYMTVVNQEHYHVFERSYVISPQKTGLMIIKPVMVRGDLLKQVLSSSAFGMMPKLGTQSFELVGPTIKLNVRDKPADFNSNWWLPAKSVTITSSWSKNNDPIKVGEPLTRMVTLTAVGVTAAQLPDIPKNSSNNFNVYLEKSKLENTILDNQVVSKRIEKIVYIPTGAGVLSVPAITIPWWNIDENREKKSVIPEQKFTVVGGITVNNNPLSPKANSQQILSINTTRKQMLSSPWFWSTIILFSLWLLTLLLWKKPWQKLKFLNDMVRTNVTGSRSAIRAIKKACFANDANKTKNALISWMHQQQFPIANLEQALTLMDSEELKLALRQLREYLYSNQKMPWKGPLFWQTFSKNHQIKPKTLPEEKKSELPELYLQ